MKSSRTIQIEFQQVVQQTNRLEDCANDLRRVQKMLDDLVDDLSSGWAGESAQAYFQKCRELHSKLGKSAQNLNTTANVIERSARAYRDAELRAIQLAQKK